MDAWILANVCIKDILAADAVAAIEEMQRNGFG